MLSSSLSVAGKPYGDTIRLWYTSYKNDGTTALTDTLAVGYPVCLVAATSAGALNGGSAGMCCTKPETALLSRFAGVIVNFDSSIGGSSSKPGWVEVCPTSTYISVYHATTVTASTNLGLVDGSWGVDDTTPTFDTCMGFTIAGNSSAAKNAYASVWSKMF